MSHKTTLPSKGIGKTLQSKDVLIQSEPLLLHMTQTTTRPIILSSSASFFGVERILKGPVRLCENQPGLASKSCRYRRILTNLR